MANDRRTPRFVSAALLAIVLAALPGPARAQERLDWENEQVVGINKLDPHSPVYPFADAATAASLARAKSPYYRLLNGQWKFQFSPNPEARPVAFYEAAFDDSRWETIPVPSNIEMQGYAPPLYVNIGYAWGWNAPPKNIQAPDAVGTFYFGSGYASGTSLPPRIPHGLNYVGSYRHRFEVPAAWSGRRVRITFEGVSAGFYLWVNGQEGRLQRGQPRAGRVRPDRLRQARREPARGRGLPLHGRLVPRVPGLLADVGHLPRRDPLVDGARARGRLPRRHRPRRAVPRRHAEGRGHASPTRPPSGRKRRSRRCSSTRRASRRSRR